MNYLDHENGHTKNILSSRNNSLIKSNETILKSDEVSLPFLSKPGSIVTSNFT
jgi:hypothetical protein